MLGDNSYASKLLFNPAAINSPKIEKIKGGGSRWAREPGWTGLKEFDIRVSISENKSSGELPFSLGILNFISSSTGSGPYFSEFENQLQIDESRAPHCGNAQVGFTKSQDAEKPETPFVIEYFKL